MALRFSFVPAVSVMFAWGLCLASSGTARAQGQGSGNGGRVPQRNSDEEGPMGRRYRPVGIYAGIGFIPRPASATGVAFRFNPEVGADAELAWGSYDDGWFFGSVKSQRVHGTGRFRFFPSGGSFNLSVGLAFDSMTDEQTYTPTGQSERERSVSTQQLEGEFMIGNRWQMRTGLMIGCDWVGYGYRIARINQTFESSRGEPSDTKDWGSDAEFKREAEDDAKDYSLHVVRFVIGYSF